MTRAEHTNDRADAVIREFLRTGKTMAEDIRPVVEMLRYALPAHFDQEEQPGGLLEQLWGSGSAAAADRLRHDHVAFLDAVSEVASSLDSGEAGIPLKLEELARRMRQHERIESIYATRFGSPFPVDADAARPPVDHAVAVALTDIAMQAAERGRAEPGSLLTGLIFTLPQGVARRDASQYLEQELALRGFVFVELEIRFADGPPRLVAVTLEPGWA